MIEFQYWTVCGFQAAIRGMRLPYKTTADSDSFYERAWLSDFPDSERAALNHMSDCFIEPEARYGDVFYFQIGEKDRKLAMQLVAAGTDHSKFMRMIHCQVMIKAPLYWWKEYDTYKVATVANSESTMHTIAKNEFELSDFSHEHLPDYNISGPIADADEIVIPEEALRDVIHDLNRLREEYLRTKNKRLWYAMIQLLPSSYNQVRMLDLNYQTLRNIYFARKGHKLDEWHEFCDWIETLPYSELITGRECHEAGDA